MLAALSGRRHRNAHGILDAHLDSRFKGALGLVDGVLDGFALRHHLRHIATSDDETKPADVPAMLQLLVDEELGNYQIGMLENTPAMTCPAAAMEQARAFVPGKAIAREYRKFLTRLSS